MKVNQQQIAKALNLSVITVSRALRDHPDLAADTKIRILQKARELGYTKFQARTQMMGNTGIFRETSGSNGNGHPARVGILLYESDEAHQVDLLRSDVRRSIFLALQKECQRREVETMIETPAAGDIPLLVKNRTVSGVFLFGRYTEAAARLLGDTPALAVSSFISCGGLPRIVADNAGGMREATEYLIGMGHKKILFVGSADSRTQIFRERADGYVVAMHRAGLVSEVYFTPEAKEVPNDLLRRFTAIACSSDSMAYTLQNQMFARGWKLPDECSMVAFDNLLAQDRSLKVTSYGPDWDLMGRLAAGLLLARPLDLQGNNVVVTVPGKLHVRGSTMAANRKD
ncbi:LacI family DNA-binding transcriptional regulator [Geminisphaera colitermitum]|uniref:LacI family DNA-binding transcriptional regulator n=1 Tax=Geminisphaera colitermitum TaxID=1148786 RepID=UPI000158CE41|nr:LacI family DNA-binding transcriptional regulator [Geminisphaera colitermitum]